MEALAESLLVWPIGICKFLVHDGHQRGARLVVRGEGATMFHGNVHRLEITLVDDVADHGLGRLALRKLIALGHYGYTVLVGKERNRTRKRRGAHAGEFARLLDQFAIEVMGLIRGVADQGGVESDHEAMVDGEAGIGRERLAKTREEHAGGNEQSHGKGDLADDKDVATDGAAAETLSVAGFKRR